MLLAKTFLLSCLFLYSVNAQSTYFSNSERIRQLIDSSITANTGSLRYSEVKVITPSSFAIYNSYISAMLAKQRTAGISEGDFLAYTIEDAGVSYPELISDIVGADLRLVRSAHCSGNIYVNGSSEIQKFSYSITDTVDYAYKDSVSNNSYGFLNPSIPSSSMFSSIWEPVAIIAALGVAFYLLFTVRKTN